MKLIQPIFVHEGDTQDTKLGKDNKLYSLYDAPDRIYQDQEQGVQEFLLFLVPLTKDNDPTWSWQGEAVEKIKALTGHHAKITVDICLCSTTTDGHCHVHDTDRTQTLLTNYAQAVLNAGADCVAPSDCQKNTVFNIKKVTGAEVMSYSAKFKSTFYRGWREAVKIERSIVRDYQLEVQDREGAIARSKQYALDGADYCMVKPGMPCLDLIQPIKRATGKPTGAFQTSGEWLGIGAPGSMRECADIFKRAGADYLITYGARLLSTGL